DGAALHERARLFERVADLLSAGHLAHAGLPRAIGQDDEVAGEERRVRAGEVQQHAVAARDRDDAHLPDQWGDHGRAAPAQSAVIFPTSITRFQRANSAACNFANSSGASATISKPCATSFGFTASSLSAATSAACSFDLISGGSPFGPATACQDVTTTPLTPASAMVGTCGSSCVRRSEVTPRARSLPALMCWTTALMFWNEASTCPPSRSLIAGAPPLYGTC